MLRLQHQAGAEGGDRCHPKVEEGLGEDLALDDVGELQGEYCAVQVKCLVMSALFCSHLKRRSLCTYNRRLMVSLLVWIA